MICPRDRPRSKQHHQSHTQNSQPPLHRSLLPFLLGYQPGSTPAHLASAVKPLCLVDPTSSDISKSPSHQAPPTFPSLLTSFRGFPRCANRGVSFLNLSALTPHVFRSQAGDFATRANVGASRFPCQ